MIMPNGKYNCDRCGTDLGNGSVVQCSILSDVLDLDEGIVILRHFCRDRVEDDKKVVGCTTKILSKRNLEYYLEETTNE